MTERERTLQFLREVSGNPLQEGRVFNLPTGEAPAHTSIANEASSQCEQIMCLHLLDV